MTSLKLSFAVTFIAALLLAAPAASASHYRLPIGDRCIVTDGELKALKREGITTTLELFERTARRADRETLARKTAIPFPRLTELASQVDLLRVTGVGPTMVRLLQTGGVRHTRDLRAAKVDALLARLQAANGIHRVTEELPPREMVEDWIDQARGMEQLLEGVQ